MKAKFLFVIIAVVTIASNAFGQGQVTLANNAATLVRYPSGNPAPVGSLLFQLYFGPAGTPQESLVPVGPVVPTSVVAAGRIANTVIDIPTAVVPAGGAATFHVRAWSSSFASYNAAAAGGGLVGISFPFNANTSPNIIPPPLPTSLAGLFTISFVPEPSTFILVGLGIVSLLFFRRRR